MTLQDANVLDKLGSYVPAGHVITATAVHGQRLSVSTPPHSVMLFSIPVHACVVLKANTTYSVCP